MRLLSHEIVNSLQLNLSKSARSDFKNLFLLFEPTFQTSSSAGLHGPPGLGAEQTSVDKKIKTTTKKQTPVQSYVSARTRVVS